MEKHAFFPSIDLICQGNILSFITMLPPFNLVIKPLYNDTIIDLFS